MHLDDRAFADAELSTALWRCIVATAKARPPRARAHRLGLAWKGAIVCARKIRVGAVELFCIAELQPPRVGALQPQERRVVAIACPEAEISEHRVVTPHRHADVAATVVPVDDGCDPRGTHGVSKHQRMLVPRREHPDSDPFCSRVGSAIPDVRPGSACRAQLPTHTVRSPRARHGFVLVTAAFGAPRAGMALGAVAPGSLKLILTARYT